MKLIICYVRRKRPEKKRPDPGSRISPSCLSWKAGTPASLRLCSRESLASWSQVESSASSVIIIIIIIIITTMIIVIVIVIVIIPLITNMYVIGRASSALGAGGSRNPKASVIYEISWRKADVYTGGPADRPTQKAA